MLARVGQRLLPDPVRSSHTPEPRPRCQPFPSPLPPTGRSSRLRAGRRSTSAGGQVRQLGCGAEPGPAGPAHPPSSRRISVAPRGPPRSASELGPGRFCLQSPTCSFLVSSVPYACYRCFSTTVFPFPFYPLLVSPSLLILSLSPSVCSVCVASARWVRNLDRCCPAIAVAVKIIVAPSCRSVSGP